MTVVSLAVLALALQIANSYIFNAVHKGGQTWRTGTAVHYVLHQDRMCTWFAVWMRPYMTLWLSRILSWGALATEAILPVMLLAPVQKVAARRVAIVCIIGLHLGFQCFINLGIFSFAMIGYTPFLLTGADWEALARFAQRRKRRLTAYFDAGCGVCFQIVRLWARLDRLGRITFRSSADLPPRRSRRRPADGGARPSCSRARWWSSTRRRAPVHARRRGRADPARVPGGVAVVAAAADARPARARQLGLRPVLAAPRVDLALAGAGGVRVAGAPRPIGGRTRRSPIPPVAGAAPIASDRRRPVRRGRRRRRSRRSSQRPVARAPGAASRPNYPRRPWSRRRAAGRRRRSSSSCGRSSGRCARRRCSR